jgi:lipopolysaccharide transport system permease protein
MFITPVVYPLSIIPEQLQPLYAINPLVGVLEAFRWTVLPDMDFPGLLLLIPVAASSLLIVSGLAYFAKAERNFADVI